MEVRLTAAMGATVVVTGSSGTFVSPCPFTAARLPD